MTIYVPVFRMAVGYVVNAGRRWSVLEQLLLIELSSKRHSVGTLATQANVPERLIIEALINLLKAGWIEVRSTDAGVQFVSTEVGKRRSLEKDLPIELQRRTKWISLCSDRLTGTWLRADDLQLVHQQDLPEEVTPLAPVINTYDTDDGSVRDLLYLDSDESFEHFLPVFRNSSHLYARFELEFDGVKGLPSYAPLRLLQRIKEADFGASEGTAHDPEAAPEFSIGHLARDTITDEDLIVGGPQHRELVQFCLCQARSYVAIHSCFVDPDTVAGLLPALEEAASRKVNVDLLWGLRSDPEDPKSLQAISAIERVLDKLPAPEREKVRLSPMSSGSHAKVILYDDKATGRWMGVVGSCNFLSSFFDAIEISIRVRSRRILLELVARLIACQQPSSGGWSAVARRLDRLWNQLRASEIPEVGTHALSLTVDDDHYACVTRARDLARKDIAIGCDLYGLAAETSALVPLRRAAEMGKRVRILYRRPSRFLSQAGYLPDHEGLEAANCTIEQAAKLHGKFLVWDDDALTVTSFNWLSTAVDGTRARAAEIGISCKGSGLRQLLARKLLAASNGELNIVL